MPLGFQDRFDQAVKNVFAINMADVMRSPEPGDPQPRPTVAQIQTLYASFINHYPEVMLTLSAEDQKTFKHQTAKFKGWGLEATDMTTLPDGSLVIIERDGLAKLNYRETFDAHGRKVRIDYLFDTIIHGKVANQHWREYGYDDQGRLIRDEDFYRRRNIDQPATFRKSIYEYLPGQPNDQYTATDTGPDGKMETKTYAQRMEKGESYQAVKPIV